MGKRFFSSIGQACVLSGYLHLFLPICLYDFNRKHCNFIYVLYPCGYLKYYQLKYLSNFSYTLTTKTTFLFSLSGYHKGLFTNYVSHIAGGGVWTTLLLLSTIVSNWLTHPLPPLSAMSPFGYPPSPLPLSPDFFCVFEHFAENSLYQYHMPNNKLKI